MTTTASPPSATTASTPSTTASSPPTATALRTFDDLPGPRGVPVFGNLLQI